MKIPLPTEKGSHTSNPFRANLTEPTRTKESKQGGRKSRGNKAGREGGRKELKATRFLKNAPKASHTVTCQPGVSLQGGPPPREYAVPACLSDVAAYTRGEWGGAGGKGACAITYVHVWFRNIFPTPHARSNSPQASTLSRVSDPSVDHTRRNTITQLLTGVSLCTQTGPLPRSRGKMRVRACDPIPTTTTYIRPSTTPASSDDIPGLRTARSQQRRHHHVG